MVHDDVKIKKTVLVSFVLPDILHVRGGVGMTKTTGQFERSGQSKNQVFHR